MERLTRSIFLALFFLTLLPETGRSQELNDTLHLKVYFKSGEVGVDDTYKDNRARVDAFRAALRVYDGRKPQTVLVSAGAAPDGNTKTNQELSEARTRSLLEYVRLNFNNDGSLVQYSYTPTSRGEDWEGLAAAIRKVREPWAPLALDIIENTPVWVTNDDGVVVDSRKNRLKKLAQGEAWRYMEDHLFPEYCAVGNVSVVYDRTPQGAAPAPQAVDLYKAEYKTESDTLEIKFKLDSIRVDRDFDGNPARIAAFSNAFRRRYANRPLNTVQLDIYAGASPEGTAAHNRWLGQNRGNAIRQYVRDTLGFKVGSINVHNLAARWDDFYDSVAATDEPWRDEVLRIIRMQPSWNEQAWDHRELKLRALRGGTVWPVLLEKHLAPLRSGGSAIISYHPERDTLYVANIYVPYPEHTAPAKKDTVYIHHSDTLVIRDTTVIIHDYQPPRKAKRVRGPADKTPAWAVKTNLLYWGVVAPNVAVEFPLGWRNRWSLEVEYIHPWFIWNNNANASQILNLGVELRLYLGNRDLHRWLDGWHLGLAVAGGKYDWEWTKHEGYQGEFINSYLNLGYQHRFGKHWAVDAGLGIGLIPSRYRHYFGGSVYPDNHLEEWDEHLIWHDTGQFLFPGPTHVNVSIVYLFNNWPIRFKTMSGERRQQWNDTYYERIGAEKQRKQARAREKAAKRLKTRKK